MLKTMTQYREHKNIKMQGREVRRKTIKILQRSCPFIQEPYDNALCSSMLTQSIENAMYYCGGHFEQCDIYRRWS